MMDPVEVIARAICRCFCLCVADNRPCWDWEGMLPEARAALDALKEAGMAVVPIELTEEMIDAFGGLMMTSNVQDADRAWSAMLAARPR
jgi:hypothetical protein